MFDGWKFLAGLAIFLLGLRFIEQALKVLAGRSFKKMLRQQTTSPIKGILAGAGVTVVLQSSTVVSLMMMAFVGAGILTLNNAIGVIFGSNLGTTVTGWIVASLGFEVEIASFAWPVVAVGGLLLAFFERREKLAEFGRLLLGFGLLFVGLSLMKESVEALSQEFDISRMHGLHPYLFFPIGVIMAAIIHSSSAIMVMGLSALNAGIIPLEAAAALAIGADLGTTSTAIIGGVAGTPAQKQVAASHFVFNLITDVMALALLYPLLWVITDVVGIGDPLFTLVTFHSVFNAIGIIVLLPFIGLIARFLQRRFKSGVGITAFISKVPTDVPEAAVEALRHEIEHLTQKVLTLNVEGLRIEEGLFAFNTKNHRGFRTATYSERYEEVKQLQGEMVKYYLRILNEKLEPDDSRLMNHYVHSLKHLLKSVKSVKDISHNIRAFEASSNDAKHALFELLRGKLNEQYLGLYHLMTSTPATSRFEALIRLSTQNRTHYDEMLTETYRQAQAGRLSETEISTFLNANREIHSANKSLIEAMSDVLLTPQEAEDFDRMPGMQ